MYLSHKYPACITSTCVRPRFCLIALRHLFKAPSQKSKRGAITVRVSNIFNKVIKVFHLDYAEEANDVVESKKKKTHRHYKKLF